MGGGSRFDVDFDLILAGVRSVRSFGRLIEHARLIITQHAYFFSQSCFPQCSESFPNLAEPKLQAMAKSYSASHLKAGLASTLEAVPIKSTTAWRRYIQLIQFQRNIGSPATHCVNVH